MKDERKKRLKEDRIHERDGMERYEERRKKDARDERRGLMREERKMSKGESSYIKANGHGSCGELDEYTRPFSGHKYTY